MGIQDYLKILGRVGPQSLGDGADAQLRVDKTGALTTVSAHAIYAEAVARGNCYTVCNQAGVTSQAGLSATTPVLTLYNPMGSGKNAVLFYAGCTFTVVFAAVAAVFLAVGTNLQAAAVTGTLTVTQRNCLLGASNTGAVVPLLAATLPAAPVAVCILGAGLTGAVNLLPNVQTLGRFFDGSVILKPGSNLSIQTGAASGASGMYCEYMWEEINE